MGGESRTANPRPVHGPATEVLQGELVAPERRVHLLVVDDEPPVLSICKAYVERAGRIAPEGVETVLHSAGSPEEALRVAREIYGTGDRLCFALIDVILPGELDGIGVLTELWELDPALHGTTMTGAGREVEEYIAARIPEQHLARWDYMTKPFEEFELGQRVRRAVSAWFANRRDELRAAQTLELLLRLSRVNDELESKVEERTRALAQRNEEQERKNEELQEALRALAAVQSSMLQQEKLASIGQLAAGVAHELNNPIGYVHSNLGTLRRYSERIVSLIEAYDRRCSGKDEELAALKSGLKVDFILEDLPALIEESLEGTERVRKIVRDLKGFSRPSEHEPKLSDLNEGLRSTLNIVHNEVKYKAKVVTDLGDLPEVRCQIGAINQVFMNMLVNAAQAIEENGEIRVTSRRDGDEVVIEFGDNGCGMPAEIRNRIFDPFFTTKGVGKGTGLGLSISYDIIRKHGGTIEVESEPGEGTTFTLRLPVEGSDELDRDA
jgi:signal transduction histidine kinase